METPFSRLFTQLRRDAGFPTAYRFYHDSGGKSVLQLSYRNYLLLEQGKTLPALARLNVFMYALHIVHRSAAAEALVSAWLKTMAGEEAYCDLIEPMLAAKRSAPAPTPMEKAVGMTLRSRKHPISVVQLEAILSSFEAYLCYLAVTADTGAWTAKEIADRLKIMEAAAAKALGEMAKVKMVKETRKGVYKCPLAGCVIEFPHLSIVPPELVKARAAYMEKIYASAAPVWQRGGVLRADSEAFRDFFPMLGASLSTSACYAVTEKTANSALFLVEGRVKKILDF